MVIGNMSSIPERKIEIKVVFSKTKEDLIRKTKTNS